MTAAATALIRCPASALDNFLGLPLGPPLVVAARGQSEVSTVLSIDPATSLKCQRAPTDTLHVMILDRFKHLRSEYLCSQGIFCSY